MAAPASARVVERWSFEDSFSGTATDFCGVEGLNPAFTFESTGSGFIREQGPDRLWYFIEKARTVVTFTYQGMTVTDIQPNTLAKDLHVVENEDGTTSVTVLLTGGNRLIGSDGKLLAKNDGQIRMLFVFDTETGEEISAEQIFGSTGTNEDFCDAILQHWGV